MELRYEVCGVGSGEEAIEYRQQAEGGRQWDSFPVACSLQDFRLFIDFRPGIL